MHFILIKSSEKESAMSARGMKRKSKVRARPRTKGKIRAGLDGLKKKLRRIMRSERTRHHSSESTSAKARQANTGILSTVVTQLFLYLSLSLFHVTPTFLFRSTLTAE